MKLLSLVLLVGGISSVMASLSEKLKKDEIVPDVFDSPTDNLTQIKYNEKELLPGDELTPTQVKDEPNISFCANANDLFSIAMVDPDAPSRENPIYREVLHWLVGNVQGADISSGDTLAGYRGSRAPKGTGLHRYIFLVYKQPNKIDFQEKRIPKDSRDGRLKFSIRDFAAKYHLEGPVAANYFFAQWDEYVDQQNAAEQLAQR